MLTNGHCHFDFLPFILNPSFNLFLEFFDFISLSLSYSLSYSLTVSTSLLTDGIVNKKQIRAKYNGLIVKCKNDNNKKNSERKRKNLKPVKIEWIRVPDLPHLNLTSKQTPHVYFSDAKNSAYRFKQGRLGNCWFCAVGSTLSDYYELISKPNRDIQNIKSSRFTTEDYFGIFHFRFYHLGVWNDVVIDDYLPTLEGQLIFAHSKDPNEFWPALLEKAYAKYVGSYAKLDGGCPLSAAIHFSGGFSQSYETSEYQSEAKIQELFQTLKAATNTSSIVTCTTPFYKNERTVEIGKTEDIKKYNEKAEESEILGLLTQHAYTIISILQYKNNQLLRIRNPWGQ